MQHEPQQMPPIELPIELWYIVGLVAAAGVARLALELVAILLPTHLSLRHHKHRRRSRRIRW